jgi:hypothetical protein
MNLALRLATIGCAFSLAWFESAAADELSVLPGPRGFVNRLIFSADGKRLAAAIGGEFDALPGEVILWNVEDWKTTLHLDVDTEPTDADFLPDGRGVAAVGIRGREAAVVMLFGEGAAKHAKNVAVSTSTV